MNKKISLIISTISLVVNSLIAQEFHFLSSAIDIPKVRSTKSGPYIGFQKGQFNLIEFGGEFQHKKITLSHPKINAIRFGAVYDYKESVLGFDLVYWRQQARFGLTYGLMASHRTDFVHTKIGIAPLLGYRLGQFHLQTGVTLFNEVENFKNVNIFFIALKFTLINKRDIDIKK